MSGLYRSPSEDSFVTDEVILRESVLRQPHEPPQFLTPLPQDQDLNYWSHRMLVRQEQALQTEEERQHVRIKLPETSLISIIGDTHIGNFHVHLQRIVEETRRVIETPHSYAILIGDLIDGFCWFPPAHEADSPVPDQIEFARSLIMELAKHKKLLVGWSGNHDHTWGTRSGNSMYKRFSRDTGAYLLSGLSFVDIEIGDQVYKIAGAHQLQGNSIYSPNHPQKRAYRFGGASGADIVVSAHTHQKAIQIEAMKEYGNQSKRVHFLNVGTYKATDEYVRDKGFGDRADGQKPSDLMYGCAIALDKDSHRVRSFYDILEAHEEFTYYLARKNGRTTL